MKKAHLLNGFSQGTVTTATIASGYQLAERAPPPQQRPIPLREFQVDLPPVFQHLDEKCFQTCRCRTRCVLEKGCVVRVHGHR